MLNMRAVTYNLSNLAKHLVSTDEAYEALMDGWARRRRDGDNYEVLGRTDDGRYLQIVVEVTEVIRIFHGRDMNDAERRRYGRK